MCKEIFKTTPDDPVITEMNPVQKLWMFENWIADQNDDAELAKNHAYLLASFWNPEAVKEIIGSDNKHISTDEEFEESLEIVRRAGEIVQKQKNNENNENNKRRRRRRIKVE